MIRWKGNSKIEKVYMCVYERRKKGRERETERERKKRMKKAHEAFKDKRTVIQDGIEAGTKK